MLQRFKNDEGGFTLIELLVVILIVGILAAIALPTFLGQQKKGQDSEAKVSARNLVTHVESCYADTQDYSKCKLKADLGTTGLPQVDGTPAAKSGEVAVTAAGTDSFTVSSASKSGGTFNIVKPAGGGPPTRTCSGGGCKGGVW